MMVIEVYPFTVFLYNVQIVNTVHEVHETSHQHAHHLQMKRVMLLLAICLLVGGVFASGFFVGRYISQVEYQRKLALLNVQGETQEKTYPLLKYSFPELSKRGGISSEIKIDRELEKTADYTAYVFYYYSDGRKISGQLNVPKVEDPNRLSPVIMMARGFVPPEEYTIGQGSRNTAAILAKAGYVTFAPDFLGFGESDPPPGETLGERFVKPISMMDLMASIQVLDGKKIEFQNKPLTTIDAKRLGLWGHSNGGQISVSILEITKQPIPTVLWAPVTKEFPYSVLYFMDEAEDKGKGLRALIANFEKDYNIDDFSIGNRLDDVSAKIQLHQGTADDAVPVKWSDEFYSRFVGKGKKDQIEYFVYPGGNHGLYPDIDTVHNRTLEFFDREVKNKQPEPTPTPSLAPTVAPSETPIPSLIPEEVEPVEPELLITQPVSTITPTVTPRR